MDNENRKYFVRKVDSDYFTDASTAVAIRVLDEEQTGTAFDLGPDACALGEVEVVERVTGFKKVKFFTHENLGYGEVHLPELRMQTSAFWLTFAEERVHALSSEEDAIGRVRGRAAVLDGIRGGAHALEAVASLALMCDPRDLGYALGDKSDGTAPSKSGAPGFDPTIFLYDNAAGGVGLSARAYELRGPLLGRTLALIERCPCADGCPACVSPGEGRGITARKSIAIALLRDAGVTADRTQPCAAPPESPLRSQRPTHRPRPPAQPRGR